MKAKLKVGVALCEDSSSVLQETRKITNKLKQINLMFFKLGLKFTNIHLLSLFLIGFFNFRLNIRAMALKSYLWLSLNLPVDENQLSIGSDHNLNPHN
jgi:hypothetical protein